MAKSSCFFLAFLFLLLICSHTSYADTIYTVKKGDSLYKIAKKFNVTAEKISEANNLASTDLKPDTKITIPAIPAKPSSAPKNTASSNNVSSGDVWAKVNKNNKDAAEEDVQYHTVKKGDTLTSLSRKYSMPVRELRDLNNFKKASRLKIGQQIAVKRIGPKTYTVEKGDTLSRIAKKFDVPPGDIMEFNDLETEDLKPGQKLLVEEWAEPADVKDTYYPILSQARIAEDIKTLSESLELESMGMKERVTLFAQKMLNIPYRFGGSSFRGIDCSAYVQKVFGLLNMTVPRSAREQFHVGEPVDKEDLSIGDLVFFRTYASFPSHVGIYLGNDLFIHASSKGKKVTINSLETPYYFKRFIGAKRLLSEESPDKKETEKKG